MGWLDVFCCRRGPAEPETERLTPPRPRGPSIVSQNGYGTMSMSDGRAHSPVGVGVGSRRVTPSAPLSLEQRERMAAISREAGSHMKSIGAYVAGRPAQTQQRRYSRESSSSRSSSASPSPPRPESTPHDSRGGSDGGVIEEEDEVVRKSIFEKGTGTGAGAGTEKEREKGENKGKDDEPSSRRSSGSSGRRRRRRVSRPL